MATPESPHDRDGREGPRSLRLLLVTSFLGFGGYALLLPVVPLWAASGGAGELSAGATTGVFMAATVAAQLAVPALLRRLGYRWVLGVGVALLGAPTPLYALSSEVAPLLGVSLLRGLGFGLLTVAGSALVAELAPPSEHGRAAARYGLAVGLPLVVLLPAGVGVADPLGFGPIFVLGGALPIAAALVVPAIRPPRRTPAPAGPAGPGIRQDWQAVRRSAVPWLAMLACATAHGGLVTFLPLALASSALVSGALFGTVTGALLGRLVAGEIADRRGLVGRQMGVGVLLAACGMASELLALGGDRPAAAVAGATLVGIGFGVVQNDTLVVMFAQAGQAGYGAASAAWNIAYDTGTGVGAVALGAVAQPFGFEAAFGVCLAMLGGVLPAALRARAAPRPGMPQAAGDVSRGTGPPGRR